MSLWIFRYSSCGTLPPSLSFGEYRPPRNWIISSVYSGSPVISAIRLASIDLPPPALPKTATLLMAFALQVAQATSVYRYFTKSRRRQYDDTFHCAHHAQRSVKRPSKEFVILVSTLAPLRGARPEELRLSYRLRFSPQEGTWSRCGPSPGSLVPELESFTAGRLSVLIGPVAENRAGYRDPNRSGSSLG